MRVPLTVATGSGEKPKRESRDGEDGHSPRLQDGETPAKPGVVEHELIDRVITAVVHGAASNPIPAAPTTTDRLAATKREVSTSSGTVTTACHHLGRQRWRRWRGPRRITDALAQPGAHERAGRQRLPTASRRRSADAR